MTGRELQKIRKQLGWTQEEMAQELGVSIRAYQYHEAAKEVPRIYQWAVVKIHETFFR